jgi:hypothetical protein
MSMGAVLRDLGGEGPIEVLTKVKDFNIQDVDNGSGQKAVVPADTLVAFHSTSFREVIDPGEPESDNGTGVWAFRTTQPTQGGAMAQFTMYVRAEDIFLIRAPSKVAL